MVLLSLEISWDAVNELFKQGWTSMEQIRGCDSQALDNFYSGFNKINLKKFHLTNVGFNNIKLLVNWIGFYVLVGKKACLCC